MCRVVGRRVPEPAHQGSSTRFPLVARSPSPPHAPSRLWRWAPRALPLPPPCFQPYTRAPLRPIKIFHKYDIDTVQLRGRAPWQDRRVTVQGRRAG
jgi:hypothetical protein